MHVECRLEDGEFKKDKEFFFTFLTEEFFSVSDEFRKVLEKRFQKSFEPIYIVSCNFSRNRKLKNYILINSGSNGSVEVNLEYEDLNRVFSESEVVRGLIGRLLKRQKRIFVLPFTSNGLKLRNRNLIVVGPKPILAKKLSNKVGQFKLFKKLGLPVKDSEYFRNFGEMDKELEGRQMTGPLFISSSCSEGGDGNCIFRKIGDLDSFFGRLKGSYIFGTNKLRLDSPFVVSRYLDITSSPNVNAIVCGEGDVRILCFSEQMIQGSKYLGNIYPVQIDDRTKSEVEGIMVRLGNYLSKIGYKGIFGCDFIICSDGKVFIVDLNPRRQTSYLPLLLMLGMENVLDLELSVALNCPTSGQISNLSKNLFWAHRRMGSKSGHFLVRESIKINDENKPFETSGMEFAEIYFPENKPIRSSLYGYYLVTGDCRESVRARLEQKTNEIARLCIQTI